MAKIYYWMFQDEVTKKYKVVGKTNEQHGFTVELDFEREHEAIEELSYLQHPRLRPKKK